MKEKIHFFFLIKSFYQPFTLTANIFAYLILSVFSNDTFGHIKTKDNKSVISPQMKEAETLDVDAILELADAFPEHISN